MSPNWVGRVYRQKAPRSAWLRDYSCVFNTVEGNSSFYSLPREDIVRRWARETEEGFKFALKFPRGISHERRLRGAVSETADFLHVLGILAEHDRLGPSFLQLPPTFAAGDLKDLARYLRELPADFPYAVEVRHMDFFAQGEAEQQLDELLAELQIDRVLLDSRPLYSAPAETDDEYKARGQKPRLPLRKTVTGRRPMLRLIGRDAVERVQPWVEEWALQVATWIRAGLTPFVFTHTPNDSFAPDLARLFQQALRVHMPTQPELPTSPPPPSSSPGMRQLDLFS